MHHWPRIFRLRTGMASAQLLLDTHVLLWSLGDPARLGRKTAALIERSEVLVSAASLWEISTKAALGKLKADPQEVLEAVDPAAFDLLPLQGAHAVGVFSLGPQHGDPFDRLQHGPQLFNDPLLQCAPVKLFGPLI